MAKKPKQLISLLVPIGGKDPVRARNWRWLREYWRHALPGCEIVIGHDAPSTSKPWRRRPKPFSKAVAINNAFKKSHGDIVVLLDSDAYLDAAVIQHCADRLRLQRQNGVRSWFVPYDQLYRLTREATEAIVDSDPKHPLVLPTPPPPKDIDSRDGSGPLNIFGAMCNVLPREAFVAVGGMDPRFRGWGGEDMSFVNALNTLWGVFKTTPNDMLHLWHPAFVGGSGPAHLNKMWVNQDHPDANHDLAAQDTRAAGHTHVMQALVDGKPKK